MFNVLAHGAEAFTFTYLGMTITNVGWDNWSLLFLICMFIGMLVGRAASIFVSSGLVYLAQRGQFGLESKTLCVVWFSGLIRGAVAFALVL